LLLTDLQLPDGNGLELLRFIREHNLPLAVVIITGAGNEEAAVAVMKAGADDYVVKRGDYLARLPITLENALHSYCAEAARRIHPLRVLYAEHSTTDIDLTRRHFEKHAPHIHLDVVYSARQILDCLSHPSPSSSSYDVLLFDYRLPGMNALELIKELHQMGYLELPVVMVTGQGDDEVAIQAIRLGASDYVVKNPGYLYQLPGVLENAFHRAQLAREQARLKASEEQYRDLVEHSQDLICTHDLEGQILSVNAAASRMLGYPIEHLLNMNLRDVLLPENRGRFDDYLKTITEQGVASGLMSVRTRSGEVRIWEYNNNLRVEGVERPIVRGMARDVTERRRAEATMKRQLDELLALHGVAMSSIYATSEDELIELVTQTIGESFYPDNFGLLLLDAAQNILRPHPSYRGLTVERKVAIPMSQGVTGQVASTGQPRRLGDVSREAAYVPVTAGVASELCVPIKMGERVIGVINAESKRADFFSDEDERLLITIAGQLATAIQQLRLNVETRRRLVELEAVNRISTALRTARTIDEMLPCLLDEALAVVGAEAGSLYTYDAEHDEIRKLEIFHRLPLHPNQDWLNFLETLAGQAAIAIDNAELFANLQRSNAELGMAYEATIEGWSKALDLRDKETEGHTQRVTELTMRLARRFGMSDTELLHMRRGALLHDIGKMGVADSILLKPGSFTDEERAIMQQHPTYAYDLLSPIVYLRPALDIPYCHHEKWDGSGYPQGLKGAQIPLAARIFAVIDVWDALTSDRPYRLAWTPEQALTYLKEQSGKHFDPQVVEAFLALQS
jgi:PAS domain S-box-containing protein